MPDNDTTPAITAAQGDPFAIVPDYVWMLGSGTALKVWCAIALHADRRDQIAWPSWKRITKLTGLSRSSVARGISELEDMGALIRQSQHRDDGSQTSTAYKLSYLTPSRVIGDTPPVSPAAPLPVSPVTPLELEPVEPEPLEGDPPGSVQLIKGKTREVKPDPKKLKAKKAPVSLNQSQINRLRETEGQGATQRDGAKPDTTRYPRRKSTHERAAEAEVGMAERLRRMMKEG